MGYSWSSTAELDTMIRVLSQRLESDTATPDDVIVLQALRAERGRQER